jgi:hypothetical protein
VGASRLPISAPKASPIPACGEAHGDEVQKQEGFQRVLKESLSFRQAGLLDGDIASRKKRKWIEHFFGWGKTTANLRKTRHKGHAKLDRNFTLAAAAHNLIRMAKPVPAS